MVLNADDNGIPSPNILQLVNNLGDKTQVIFQLTARISRGLVQTWFWNRIRNVQKPIAFYLLIANFFAK